MSLLRRGLALLAAGFAIPAAAVGIAWATSPSGVTADAHITGAQLSDDTKANADGVKLQTKVPTDVSVLTLTIDPGGSTGWHSHPGLAVIAVAEGTGKLYSADCRSKTFSSGDAFIESGRDAPTVFRNESSSPVVLTVSFITPRGAAIIRDEADLACGLS